MNKELITKINMSTTILRIIVSFVISSLFILLITRSSDLVWKSCILFPVGALSYLILRFSKNIWLYLGFHAVLIFASVSLIHPLVLQIASIIFIITFAAIQLAKLDISYHYLILLIGIYFVLTFALPKLVLTKQLFFGITIVFILAYLLNLYYVNLYTFIKDHVDKSNIPFKQIKSSNRITISGFVLLSVIIMLIGYFLPVNDAFKTILQYMRRIFKLHHGNVDQVEQNSPDIVPPEQHHGVKSPMPKADPVKFWEIASDVIMYVILIFILVMLIRFIIIKFTQFYRFYYSKKEKQNGVDTIEIVHPIEKKSTGIRKRRRTLGKGFLSIFGISNNEKIRKIYLRSVQKNTRLESSLDYKTPSELSSYALLSGDNQTQEEKKKSNVLTTIYERARYSNEECSRDELQSVKNILK